MILGLIKVDDEIPIPFLAPWALGGFIGRVLASCFWHPNSPGQFEY